MGAKGGRVYSAVMRHGCVLTTVFGFRNVNESGKREVEWREKHKKSNVLNFNWGLMKLYEYGHDRNWLGPVLNWVCDWY